MRYTAMMMASPTAASAAATTITKKTKICPLSACQCAAKATKERFTPLSISSIDMKMVMMLRLIKKPGDAAGEQNPAQHQIIRKRNHQSSFSPLRRFAACAASTTAPMIAIRIRIDVTSNGSRKS